VYKRQRGLGDVYKRQVQDVVMHERGEVDELDDGRPSDQVDGGTDASTRAEREERAEALAGVGEDFAHHRPDFGFEASLLFREERLEGREVRF
jgi:hypothetical protein